MNMADGVFFHQLYAARMVTITLQAAALLCTQAQQDTQRDTSDDDSMMRREEMNGSRAATQPAPRKQGDDDAGQKSSSQTALLFIVVSGDGCYIFVFVYFGTKPDRSCRMMCENFGRVTIYDSVCFMSTFFNNNGALAPHTHTHANFHFPTHRTERAT